MEKTRYRVVYTVKNDKGFIVDKTQQFPTFEDAKVFIRLLREAGNLIGRPCVEIK